MIGKGQIISDRYEILRQIGEGGMANVYLAHDIILDRKVAIKVLRGDLATDEKFVRRFQREALSASSLSHPNIVEMYDVGEDNGMYFIVMEYVEGKTLKQLLKRRGNLTLSEAIDIMLQLTDGIAHAHESYIIHRDLKPQNIMIQENGMIKITDFGIAMALNSTQLTQTNSVMGSVHYLPPEQASGKGSTVKSDIYSMGILFYELLTGMLPFKGENAVEIALKQMRDPLPSVRALNPAVPQSIENIIMKATAKNPKNRYDNVKQMHDDLLTALDEDRLNEPIHVYKYPEHDVDETKAIPVIKKRYTDEDLATPEEVDDDDKETKKRKILIWILTGLLSVIVLVLLIICVVVPKIADGKEVRIPNVADMTVDDAINELEKAGLKVADETEKVTDEKIEAGHVVKTSPSIGRTVKKGKEITIYESTGSEAYTVEDYKGKNYIEVKTTLELSGITVKIEKKSITDDSYKDDTIISQDVEAGKQLKKGETITFVVAKVEIVYPDMVGEQWTKKDVQSFCDKYNLSLTLLEAESSDYPAGTVMKQSRNAGEVVVEGASIRVTIAIAPTNNNANNGNNGNNDNNENTSTSSEDTN